MSAPAPRAPGAVEAGPVPQACFDDLYTAVYAIIDDAKTDHDLVKLYKGSHGSPDPHPVVTGFGEYFFRTRRGLLAYAASLASPRRAATVAGLDAFDAQHRPRIRTRAVFDLLAEHTRQPGETTDSVLAHLTARTHRLGAYRGGSSGYDDEARAFAAAHFRTTGLPVTPGDVLIFSGGAKGAFLAFCAAIMTSRHHDELRHHGGLMLAPAGYYQSLRLIPPLFGGQIRVTPDLDGDVVRAWLAGTAACPRRCVYVPLVNNADGHVLTAERARSIAHAILTHNAARPHQPVHVLADDVYTGSYLAGASGTPIGGITGADLGDPGLGRMSDWTLSVVTPSKTFALPTSRVAFAATTSPALASAAAHYRTVFSLGRIPQISELTAAAAICLTPQTWIDTWNARYRDQLADVSAAITAINTEAGFEAFHTDTPGGGWYLPLRICPALIPIAASAVDAFAVLLHYGNGTRNSGIATLPGELFGYRAGPDGFLLRGTLAAGQTPTRKFTERLREAAAVLTGPDGSHIAERAIKRARSVADLDVILANTRW